MRPLSSSSYLPCYASASQDDGFLHEAPYGRAYHSLPKAISQSIRIRGQVVVFILPLLNRSPPFRTTTNQVASSSLRVCFTCETNRRLQVRFRWPSRHVLVECRLHLRGRIRFLGHRPLSLAIYLRPRLRNGALDRNLFRRGIWCVLTIAIRVDKFALIPSCHLFWCFLSLNSEESESHQVSENSFFVEPNFFTDSSSGYSEYKQLWL